MKTLIALCLLCLPAQADEATATGTILRSNVDYTHQLALKQQPIGSQTSFVVNTNNNTITFSNHTSRSNWTVNTSPPPFALPHSYKDADSGIIFYVETDGRHLTALTQEGKILWSKDPFADAQLEFYRTHNPRIVFLERIDRMDKAYNWMVKGKAGKYLAIAYNSSQSGIVDIATGEFTFMGRN